MTAGEYTAVPANLRLASVRSPAERTGERVRSATFMSYCLLDPCKPTRIPGTLHRRPLREPALSRPRLAPPLLDRLPAPGRHTVGPRHGGRANGIREVNTGAWRRDRVRGTGDRDRDAGRRRPRRV